MNDVNRGALRGMAISLATLRDALEAMCNAETGKEDNMRCGSLITARFDTTSTELDEAAILVDKAIKIIYSIAENPADFESSLGTPVNSDVPVVIVYGKDNSRIW